MLGSQGLALRSSDDSAASTGAAAGRKYGPGAPDDVERRSPRLLDDDPAGLEDHEVQGDHEEQVEEAVEIPAAGGRPALGFMPNYEDGVLGVLVEMVVEGGPAEAGGVRAGDVIIGIDDRDVDSVSDYMEALANLTVGQRVKVRVQRGDEQKSFDVKVGQRSQ